MKYTCWNLRKNFYFFFSFKGRLLFSKIISMADGIQIWSRFPSTLPEQNRRSLELIIDPLKGDLSIPSPKPLPF